MLQIPNLISILNLVIGIIAIVISFDVDLLIASPYLILICALLDFLDGFMAKLLNAVSEFGKILDSLADIVSFGVAPSILLFHMLKISIIKMKSIGFNLNTLELPEILILSVSLLIPIFSALRLSKFMIDDKQKHSFIGLPTPASAILISSITIVFFNTESETLQNLIANLYFLIPLILLISILLVMRIPMFSLKFQTYGFTQNAIKYIFLGISFLLLVFLKLFALPIIIVLYIIFSIIHNLVKA